MSQIKRANEANGEFHEKDGRDGMRDLLPDRKSSCNRPILNVLTVLSLDGL